MIKSSISGLRILAYLEGFSFIILMGIGMPLKYMYNMPMPNYIIGMLHGVLFIAYCMFVMRVRSQYKWNLKTTFWSLLAAFLPFGTFVADAKIFKPIIENSKRSL